jgi:heat shock protein HtpX
VIWYNKERKNRGNISMNLQRDISENKRNTIFIMAAFIGIVGAIGWLVAYSLGNISALYGIVGIRFLFVVVQYFMADKLALMSTGAKQIQQSDNPRLWAMVQGIAQQTQMPMPKLYIVEDPAPNAFATGRDPAHAVVAATTGILEVMDDRELRAVLAHEMSHVKNYDIRVSMIAFGLTSVIGALTNALSWAFMFGGGNNDEDRGPGGMIVGIVLIVLAPIAALLIQMAISRQREYLADASGASITNDPEGLANALGKLQTYGVPMKRQDTTTAHLFIANPLKTGAFVQLFSTHPPLEERIRRLKTAAGL